MKIIVGHKFHHDHDAIIGDLKEDSGSSQHLQSFRGKIAKKEAFQMEIPNLEIIISRGLTCFRNHPKFVGSIRSTWGVFTRFHPLPLISTTRAEFASWTVQSNMVVKFHTWTPGDRFRVDVNYTYVWRQHKQNLLKKRVGIKLMTIFKKKTHFLSAGGRKLAPVIAYIDSRCIVSSPL